MGRRMRNFGDVTAYDESAGIPPDWKKANIYARQLFPRLRSIPKKDVNTILSQYGKHYSETYPKRELFNPEVVNRELESNKPVRHTIEIRPMGQDLSQQEAMKLMGGELMHLLPLYDKRFAKLREKYQAARDFGYDDPTPSWLVDAAIRGEISPLTKKEGREWKRGEQFEGNEDSRLAMQELRKYMTGR